MAPREARTASVGGGVTTTTTPRKGARPVTTRLGIEKTPTGLPGLDTATRGGLPRIGTTLLSGRAGSGKTVLALQVAALAARQGRSSIVVSFEEPPEQLRRNTRSFPWGDALAMGDRVRLVDGRPQLSDHVAGAFDVEGLLAVLDALAAESAPAWIVLDGIDQLLALQPDEATAITEIRRIDEWSRERGLATLLTCKRTETGTSGRAYLDAIEFLLSTSITLSTTSSGRRLARHLRIVKYRGSPHATDDIPMIVDEGGVHLPLTATFPPEVASVERVGSGIPHLDAILGGGIFRGSTLLISGAPGTSKSTLAASFALAAAERDETALFLSFDEPPSNIVRNVASVGIDLAPHIERGRVAVRFRAAWESSAEQHVIRIQQLLDEVKPALLVIDPVSALQKASHVDDAYLAIEYVLSLTRSRNITTLMTSLTNNDEPSSEATLSHTSTIADTWITLDYRVLGGERNRALSIVKSRGTAHSNQVRELLLGNEGIELASVYRYGSDVLMGTARVQAEDRARAQRVEADRDRARRRRDLEDRLAATETHRQEAAREAERLRSSLDAERRADRLEDEAEAEHEAGIVARREPGARSGGTRRESTPDPSSDDVRRND